MLRTPICLGWFISLSLFGGLAFADAPIANFNTDNSTTTAQVVNSQAILSSLTPDQRIARLENQVQYLSTYNNQLQSLSAQVNALRGQMEDLTHQVQLLQNQVKTPITPASSPAATTTTTTSAATQTNSTAATLSPEQIAFNQAYTLLTQKKYAQATTAFNNFLTKYPKSAQASTAHYWLGDLYLAQGMPEDAAKQYKVTATTVNAAKRPDAMLQLGTILLAYGDNAHAKQLFQALIKNYPGSTNAIKAQKALNSMSQGSPS
jgi:tol-pal system protein YbgF